MEAEREMDVENMAQVQEGKLQEVVTRTRGKNEMVIHKLELQDLHILDLVVRSNRVLLGLHANLSCLQFHVVSADH